MGWGLGGVLSKQDSGCSRALSPALEATAPQGGPWCGQPSQGPGWARPAEPPGPRRSRDIARREKTLFLFPQVPPPPSLRQ